MKRQLLRARTPSSRWCKSGRLWVVAGLGLFCAALAYAFWSKSVWDGVIQSDGGKASVLAKIDAAFTLPVDSAEERESKKEALRQIVTTVQAAKDLCYINSMIAWQQNIGNLKQYSQRCIENRGEVQQFERQLQSIMVFLQDDANVAAALSEFQAQKGEISEADFASIAIMWEKTMQQVGRIEVNEQFKPVKEKLVASLEMGTAKWKELISAHEAKDKVRFLKAQQEIITISSQLAAMREVEQQEILKLIESFKEALASLR